MKERFALVCMALCAGKVVIEINRELKLKNGRISLAKAQSGCRLYFYGDIVSSDWQKWSDADKCPQEVADILAEIPRDAQLDIYINSGGGDVFAGIAIYHQLKRRTGLNVVHVDGLAASIASVIAMAGDDIIIPASAQMMIHKPWACPMGNADELRKTADALDGCQDSIMEIYMTKVRPGVERGTIEEMVNAETWMTGRDAAKYFDVTVDDVAPAAACVSGYFEKYRNVPGLDTIGGTLISAKADAEAMKIQSAFDDWCDKAQADEIERMKTQFELLKLQCELDAI
jgi:Protease subunit of ATP-dependent Clp proteases